MVSTDVDVSLRYSDRNRFLNMTIGNVWTHGDELDVLADVVVNLVELWTEIEELKKSVATLAATQGPQ